MELQKNKNQQRICSLFYNITKNQQFLYIIYHVTNTYIYISFFNVG